MEAEPDYLIVLRPEPSSVPGVIRLRRFLKAALRAYGLRCTSLREQPRQSKPPTSPRQPRRATA